MAEYKTGLACETISGVCRIYQNGFPRIEVFKSDNESIEQLQVSSDNIVDMLNTKHTPKEIIEQCILRWQLSDDFTESELKYWITAAETILAEFEIDIKRG